MPWLVGTYEVNSRYLRAVPFICGGVSARMLAKLLEFGESDARIGSSGGGIIRKT